MRRAASLVLVLAAFASTGCDKLKARAGKGGDGDAAAPSGGSTGGVLGTLFDSNFEGEITTEITGKGDKTPKTLAIDIKSPKLRADLGALATAGKDDPFLSQGAAFILDPPAKKAYMLVPAKKMAMVIDFEKMKQQKAKLPQAPGSPGAAGGKAEEPPKIDKTGKKDTVAGYTCEIWKITSKDGSRAELCMAEGIKLMDFSDLAMQSPQFAAAAALGDLNHFPLRAVGYDKAGVEEGRLEAKKIEKKKLPDSQFTVPPDYQQMDMAAMMAGMMGGGMGGPPGHPGAPPHLPPNFKPPAHK